MPLAEPIPVYAQQHSANTHSKAEPDATRRSVFFRHLKRDHVPAGGVRYWMALCLASILGCNCGDLFASAFGFLNGLPILVVAFMVVLFASTRDHRRTEVYYWVAVILVRTAATNLADFAGHQLGITVALAMLSTMLLLALFVRRPEKNASRIRTDALPTVDGLYWGTMLIAGTLGTAIGDFSSFMSGLGLPGASLALSVLAGLLISGKLAWNIPSTIFYWVIVVAIRAAGTSVGDFMAGTLGLWQSTAIFAIILIGFLMLFPRQPEPGRSADAAASLNEASALRIGGAAPAE